MSWQPPNLDLQEAWQLQKMMRSWYPELTYGAGAGPGRHGCLVVVVAQELGLDTAGGFDAYIRTETRENSDRAQD
ncbi:hypothetical protein GCM10009585_03980 [Brevibacterium paucivorans]